MKRISVRLITALITFTVGVGAASVWFLYLRPKPSLTVCEVVRNRDSYISQNIRVRGTLLGYDETGFYEPNCEGAGSYVHVNFDLRTWDKLKEKLAKVGGQGMHGTIIWANATLSGRFEKLQGVDCVNGKHTGLPDFGYDIYCYVLNVSEIDEVESAPPVTAFPD